MIERLLEAAGDRPDVGPDSERSLYRRLHEMDFDDLSALDAILKSCPPDDKQAAQAFRTVVRRLAKSPQALAALSRAKGADRRACLLKLAAEIQQQLDREAKKRRMAEAVLKGLRPSFVKALPAECTIKEHECIHELVSLISAGIPAEKLVDQFSARFREAPKRFVNNYRKIFEEQARGVFNRYLTDLQQSLPKGATLKRAACERLLVSLMESDTPPPQLISRFVDAIQDSREDYVSGLPQPKPAEIATSIFQQLEPQLRKSLPPGCSLNRKNCLSCLEMLAKEGKRPEQIVEKFLETLKSDPALLVDGFAEMMKAVRSSGPVSMNRSEARRA